MKILGIESSCDETSAAIIEGHKEDRQVTLVSNVVASSLALHAKTGGIIPEVAAREQLKYIIPVVEQALKEAEFRYSGLGLKTRPEDLSRIQQFDSGVANAPQNDKINIDAIAVTVGPGLIGSLLVGIETAKTLAFVWNKPIISVNHLVGHIYANWLITNSQRPTTIQFPSLALIVSGGHTDLVLMKGHNHLTWIGGTRDDAAGEAFDKIGRLLGLSYPAGPIIAKLAENGNPKAFNFPRPMIDSDDFDFSFSGLKSAVYREVKTIQQFNNSTIANISASVQQAIVDVLVSKTIRAAVKFNVKSILLSGGVASNQKLREQFAFEIGNLKLEIGLFAPPTQLCTDNAAMIATAAFFNNKPEKPDNITASPQLHF